MAIYSGQLGTTDVLQAQLKVDMGTKVFALDPPGNPYTRVMTKRLKSVPARQTTFRWMEDDIVPFWTTSAETVNSSATDMDVATGTGAYFQVGDLVKVATTGEVLRITVIAGDNLTFTRSWGATAAATITSGDYLLNMRAAATEGATSPTARATVKVEKTNYTQIVKTPVHITNTNDAVDHYHGSELLYQERKAGEDHGRTWEEIALHGEKNIDTGGAKPIRSTGGLDEHITSNVLSVSGGTLTEPEFRDFLGDCFRYRVNGGGGGSKVLLASRSLKHTIDSWGLNKLQMNEKAKATYGMDVMTYIGSTGRVEVVYDPLLENGYAGTSYLIDPDGTMFRPLQNRSTRLERNIQAPDEDGKKHQYITEAGFQFALEKCFGKITGVTY